LPDEEKAKVLRRHLVSKVERMPPPEARSSAASDADVSDQRTSRTSSIRKRPPREDSEPFPIPYHAPGADIT
jgi:proton-coupled amino acid transporter